MLRRLAKSPSFRTAAVALFFAALFSVFVEPLHTAGILRLKTGDYNWLWIPTLRSLLGITGAFLLPIIVLARCPGILSQSSIGRGIVSGIIFTILAIACILQMQSIDAFADTLFAVLSILVCLVAWYLILRFPIGRYRFSAKLIYIVIPVATIMIGSVASAYLYKGFLVFSDSQSQLAQAHLLLTGNVTWKIDQGLRDVLAFPYALETVPSYSQYPPGHLMGMALVMAVKLPPVAWGIIMFAVTALLSAQVAGRIAGRSAAILAGALVSLSPLIHMMATNGMNHMTAAALSMATLLCFGGRRSFFQGSPFRLFCGGFCGALLFSTRPLNGAVFGLTWGLIALFGTDRKGFSRAALWGGLGTLIPILCLAWYNHATTGVFYKFPYSSLNPELSRWGFHSDGPYPHNLHRGLQNLTASLFAVDWYALGCPISILSLVVIIAWRMHATKQEWAILILIIAQCAAYVGFHYHDLFIGPRFLFEVIPFFFLLTAVAFQRTLSRPGLRRRLVTTCLAVLMILPLPTAWRFWKVKHGEYVGYQEEIKAIVERVRAARKPAIIYMPIEYSDEKTGDYFPSGTGDPPIYFVRHGKLKEAMKRPELMNLPVYTYPP